MKKALYPASFDPITYGHMDVVSQALEIYDKVVMAVLGNSKKGKGFFTFDERKQLIEEIYKDNTRVEVIAIEDKVTAVKIALENDCSTMIRGLRDVTDFAQEKQLAELNLMISKEKVNTVAFFANPRNVNISSTNVRELFSLGEDISSFVHPIVYEAMKNKQ